MNEPIKYAVYAATRRFMEPLAQWLLDAGLGIGEFKSLAMSAFVHAASQSASSGQRPNISRISAVTGLQRSVVAKLLARSIDAPPQAERGRHRAERVLSGWWNDPDFLESYGRPVKLPLRGKRSFTALVKRHSGDPRVTTIREELLRVKVIRRLADGKLEAISRHYATAPWDPAGVAALGEQMREHLETLLRGVRQPGRAPYARSVLKRQLDPRYAAMFARDFAEHADTWMESIDASLNDPEGKPPRSDRVQNATDLGVTIYLYEKPVIVEPKDSLPTPQRAATPRMKAKRR